jgi:hypothetical protein
MPDVQRVIANGIRWARPQGVAANTPRHVPVEPPQEKIADAGQTPRRLENELSTRCRSRLSRCPAIRHADEDVGAPGGWPATIKK